MSQRAMENETVAVDQTVEMELGEIKTEPPEMDSRVDVVACAPAIKDEPYDDSDGIDLQRIKEEPTFVETCSNQEVFEMQDNKANMEEDLDCKQFEAAYITENGLVIKQEHDYPDYIDGHNLEVVLNSSPKHELTEQHHTVPEEPVAKSYSCYNCYYTTSHKYLLIKHMQEHRTFLDSSKVTICIHCNAAFSSRIALFDHIIRLHPEYIDSVTSKILECTHCTFKTTSNSNFARHMTNHSEATDSDNLSLCIHCNATFKSKTSLDDHTIREHPDFIASVSCKVHECPCCAYKTTVKGSFDRHMLKHPETVDSYKLSVCVHCDAKFKSKTSLDSHTIREHPDFIVSVSSKIHACPHCPYKTVMKANLDRHMSKHPESGGNVNLSVCVQCNATYKSKKNLDDHIIKKHPECIASISSKVHECTYCTYKTTVKGHLTEHMIQHTEIADMFKLRCIHCDETFKRRTGLDEHIINKHPHLIATITSKIHECKYCAYQTVLKPHFARHMLKHPETADNYKLKICVHCNAKFKSKASLDNHTVREHPDFVASVSNKLHECSQCTYKTTLKSNFSKHMRKHSKAV